MRRRQSLFVRHRCRHMPERNGDWHCWVVRWYGLHSAANPDIVTGVSLSTPCHTAQHSLTIFRSLMPKLGVIPLEYVAI
jgi:hypothetical protein